ncbi:hypothetical protein SAMN05216431_10153 [Ligilactobacillus sp. WC1T17]|uniref:Uncharacterized protein n=1 Tax=Ligilactobacillus ruminis TaxID=1623 RepID=A0ABY1A8W5_9LACO|nr:hypothetical protein SAMN05216431_10153 [Ligilactobacillus ruminis]
MIKRWIKEVSIARNWRKKNNHNKTRAKSFFDTNSVEVGKNTYGDLNILQYDQNATLKIGSNVSIAGGGTISFRW